MQETIKLKSVKVVKNTPLDGHGRALGNPLLWLMISEEQAKELSALGCNVRHIEDANEFYVSVKDSTRRVNPDLVLPGRNGVDCFSVETGVEIDVELYLFRWVVRDRTGTSLFFMTADLKKGN